MLQLGPLGTRCGPIGRVISELINIPYSLKLKLIVFLGFLENLNFFFGFPSFHKISISHKFCNHLQDFTYLVNNS